MKITLVGGMDDINRMPKGLMAHPYITEKITIRLDKSNMNYVNNIIQHFDTIFGVGDDTKGLFSFGPSKQRKREGEALKAMGSMLGAAIKAARDGDVPEDAMAKVTDTMNKVDDAATFGLTRYTRLADEAEAKI